jgi:hypothetical protein
MTKEIPMTNAEDLMRPTGLDLSFELRHYLVIRASSLVIHPSISQKALGNLVYGH